MKPYQISFSIQGGRRITWERYGKNLESALASAKRAAKKEYASASAFLIKPLTSGQERRMLQGHRINPATKTIKAPKGKTKEVVDMMVRFLKTYPTHTYHPSLFTYTMRGARGNIAPAIRYLKGMGLIEIVGYNIDNQPLYGASELFKQTIATGAKKNPKKNPKETRYPYRIMVHGKEVSLIYAANQKKALAAWERERKILHPASRYHQGMAKAVRVKGMPSVTRERNPKRKNARKKK